jgi:fumarylacetoacetase
MAESWVFGGNDPELGRGLNHLPYTAFVDEATGERRLGVGIGACVLDLAAAAEALPQGVRGAVREPQLNGLMELGTEAWGELRGALQFLLSSGNKDRGRLEAALLPVRGLRLEVPCAIGDYTDFYASRDHARQVGELFRPERPLLENYEWVPIAYHGRASSIVASGTPVRRPLGQMRGSSGVPSFGAAQKLDYELELGYWIGVGNQLGEPVPVAEADARIFGVSLLNDWSARDVQAWEYQPLGPFLGKNFCTTVSPWITPMAALEVFRVPGTAHPCGTLAYLEGGGGGLGLRVEGRLSTVRSRAEGLAAFRVSAADTDGLYWTPAQMVAHHTSNGCNLRAGDLLGTGTISGACREEAGCLLELRLVRLPNGEERRFLEDGDEVTLVGWGEREGELPVRLGECAGKVEGLGSGRGESVLGLPSAGDAAELGDG